MSQPEPQFTHKSWRTKMLLLILLGMALFCYGLSALFTGKVISTWAQMAYRPSIIYWITVLAFLLIGGMNVVLGCLMLRRG